MEIQNLPMFNELSKVLCSYKIESWQAIDFYEKVKLLKLEDDKINYHGIYRLLRRLVIAEYLVVDFEDNHRHTTYTESEKLQEFRKKACDEAKSTIQELNSKKEKLEYEVHELEEEIQALEDLKKSFPQIQFKIEQLSALKSKERKALRIQIRAINSLSNFDAIQNAV